MSIWHFAPTSLISYLLNRSLRFKTPPSSSRAQHKLISTSRLCQSKPTSLAMSDFAVILAEEGDTSSAMRSRNLEGEDFRQVLINQGSHGHDFITRAEIVAVASGFLTEKGPPATIVIFRFNFVNTEKEVKRRFVSAKIKVEFSDVRSRGNMDPEVFAISPDGEVHLDKQTLSKDVDRGIHAGLAAIKGVDIGFEWKVSETKEKEYWVKQMGIKFNSRTTFTGADNTAIWQLVEHASKKQGIPSFFQTAVLLQRRGDDKVVMKITIESEIDTQSAFKKAVKKRFFGGVVTEPVDPVNISSKMFKIGDLDDADELKANSPALKSMATLINMRKFTGVERRLTKDSTGKEQEGGQKGEQKGEQKGDQKDEQMEEQKGSAAAA